LSIARILDQESADNYKAVSDTFVGGGFFIVLIFLMNAPTEAKRPHYRLTLYENTLLSPSQRH